MKRQQDSPASGRVDPSCGGFTLPEILIAVAILSIGIVAVLEAFNVSISALGSARDALRSSMLIMEKMAATELSAVAEGKLDAESSNGSFDGYDSNYRWECEITDVSVLAGPAPDTATLNRIDLAVRREGSSRRYSASTCLRVEKPKR